jgi:monovalent cation:H+ antiporter-2, CPA2 family
VHGFELLATLAGGLTAALVCGYVTQRIGLSPLVGYLVAGILVGPHTPGFVADAELAEQLAEMGVVLLMFGVGLQFHVSELLAVRRVAIPGALVQSAVATALGGAMVHAMGWGWPAAIVFGVALSVASTVVLIRVLSDNRSLHTPSGHIAVGWLVVEDLFTVLVLVLLPAMFGGEGGSTAVTLALTAAKVGALVVFTVVVGSRFIPWLLDRVARTHSRELFTLSVLAIVLGIAVGSAELFGVSMALGAFLAGLVVGRSDYSVRAASDALPMRDAFAVLFFVSVGMLLDPRVFLESPLLIAGTLAVVLLGKPLAALVVVLALRYPFKVALTVAVALAQIGEFSFILGDLGVDLGLLTPLGMNAIVAVAILSIMLNPILYRAIDPVERWVAARPALSGILTRPVALAAADRPAAVRADGDERHHAIVVGYGPTGRTLTRLLVENGIEPAIIELNIDTARELRAGGRTSVYGDASQRATLESAGVQSAGSLLLTADVPNSPEVIRQAKELNPRILVLARTTHLRDAAALRQAGAQTVFSGEGEVALALTESVLRRLGATPDQIDRERERLHTELGAVRDNGGGDRGAGDNGFTRSNGATEEEKGVF